MPAGRALQLPSADADEPTRQDLAISLLPRGSTVRAVLPGLWSATTNSNTAATRTVDDVIRDLYNPAQLDVLHRVGLLLRSRPDPDPADRVHHPVDASGASWLDEYAADREIA